MPGEKAIREAMEDARKAALARGEPLTTTLSPGESLYNVVVRAALQCEHAEIPTTLPALPDTASPEQCHEWYERHFALKTEETFYERIVFAPDAAGACKNAEDSVVWDFGPDELLAESCAPLT